MKQNKPASDVVEETAERAEPKGYASGIPVYCAHDAIVPISQLRPNPKNPNKHPHEQIKKLGYVIGQSGWRQPITVSKRSGMIVKGEGRLLASRLEEWKEAPVDYQDYSSEADELADLYADNYLAELSETDNNLAINLLAGIVQAGTALEKAGITQQEYDAITTALAAEDEEEETEDVDEGEDTETVELPAIPFTMRGDIWILGKHRVMCGDCTISTERDALLDGARPEILLTDPPYCSGGQKEAAKATGSIGTKRKNEKTPMIANDILSTRGYQNLIGAALKDIPCLFAYVFTDWRMWVYLFDLVESASFGAKSMIIWDKKFPGMGIGWRSQHEIIMFAAKAATHFDGHKGYGNVLSVQRVKNEFHPTQKPLELIASLVDNMEWASGIYDPFGGSGTTLIAAEDAGQQAYVMELTPGYTDVIVERYIRHTGRDDVVCIRHGKEMKRSDIMPLISRAVGGNA